MRAIFFLVQTKMTRACKLGSDTLFIKITDQAIPKLAPKAKPNDSLNGVLLPYTIHSFKKYLRAHTMCEPSTPETTGNETDVVPTLTKLTFL